MSAIGSRIYGEKYNPETGIVHADLGILGEEAESPGLPSEPERVARGRELGCGDTFVLGDHIVECQPSRDLPDPDQRNLRRHGELGRARAHRLIPADGLRDHPA